ncbi:MAG: hypothetical protein RL264_2274 [Bacteroidota bacterium]|jgi:hypothetical protein
MKQLLFVFFSIFGVGCALTQTPSTRITKDEVLIGQTFDLIYSIEFKANESFRLEKLSGKFPAKLTQQNATLTQPFKEMEIVAFHDTIVKKGNKKTWVGVYELCPWDSGLVVLDGITAELNGQKIVFPSAYIESRLVPRQKGKDIYDIREGFTDVAFPKPWWYYFGVYVAWWLLPLIGWVLYRFIIKRKKKEVFVEPELSLREKTLKAIDALEQAELWRADRMKEHFVEFSYILRSYLTHRYEVNLLDKTTNETRFLLKAKGLDKPLIDTILKLLNHSDMVKFAASSPQEEIVEMAFYQLRQLILETSPIEYVHAQ